MVRQIWQECWTTSSISRVATERGSTETDNFLPRQQNKNAPTYESVTDGIREKCEHPPIFFLGFSYRTRSLFFSSNSLPKKLPNPAPQDNATESEMRFCGATKKKVSARFSFFSVFCFSWICALSRGRGFWASKKSERARYLIDLLFLGGCFFFRATQSGGWRQVRPSGPNRNGGVLQSGK